MPGEQRADHTAYQGEQLNDFDCLQLGRYRLRLKTGGA